jgi:O-antigen chain-terminating methyltransferase
MSRIREEANRRRERIESSSSNGNGHVLSAPPSAPATASAVSVLPTLHISTTADLGERLRSLSEEALQKTEVDRRVPKVFRRLFRKQGGFNKVLLEIVRLLLRSDSRLSQRNSEIVAYLSAQNHWLQAWVQGNTTKTSQTETLLQTLSDQYNDLRQVAKDLETDIQAIGDDLLGYGEQLREFRSQSANSIAQLHDFQKTSGQATEALDEHLSRLRTQFDALQASHVDAGSEIESLRSSRQQIEAELEQFRRTGASQNDVITLRDNVDGLKDRLGVYEKEAAAATNELTTLKEKLVSRETQAALFERELAALRENLGGLKEWLNTHEAARNATTQELVSFKQTLLDRENQIEAVERELTALRESNGGMREWLGAHETQLTGASGDIAALKDRLTARETQAGATERDIIAVRESTGGMKEWLANHETQINGTSQDIAALKDRLTARETQAGVTERDVIALRENNGGMKEWLTSHDTQIGGMIEKLTAAEREQATLREHLGGLQDWLADRETLAHKIFQDLTAVKESLTAREIQVDAMAAELTALRENVGGMKEWLSSVGDKTEDARARADALQKQADRYSVVETAVNARLAELSAAIEAARNQTRALDQRQATDGAFLKAQLSFHSGALQALTVASPAENAKDMADVSEASRNIRDHAHDAFYLAFENQFRGSRADIQQRVRIYLPSIKAAGAGQLHAPALDLGCGRGEWLELLRDEQLIGRGVDLNEFMVAECIGRGLAAEQADVLEFLGTLPSDSQGAITAFHLIEHLPFSALLRIFSESLRVLRPGGVCIFETPNPDNIQVGSNRFYIDPTHVRPLPKEFTKFVMANAGFSRVAVLPLHPVADSPPPAGTASPAENFVNRAFFGDQDYAVIGHK